MMSLGIINRCIIKKIFRKTNGIIKYFKEKNTQFNFGDMTNYMNTLKQI